MLTGHFLNFFVRLFLSEQFRERDRGVSKVLSIATESYFYTWVRSLTRVTISLRALLEIHEKNHFMTSFTIFREERWKWCLTRLKYNYIDRERKKEKRAKQHTKNHRLSTKAGQRDYDRNGLKYWVTKYHEHTTRNWPLKTGIRQREKTTTARWVAQGRNCAV